jgi:hypothetical protein
MDLLNAASIWLAAHSAAVQAAATVATVLLTGVLAITTIVIARSTAAITDESRRARLAAEEQVSAAQKSDDLLRQQFQHQDDVSRSVVRSAIGSAENAIAYWKLRPLSDTSKAAGFPPSDNLVPGNAFAAVEHARSISLQAAEDLSSAFDDLRNAVNEIERTRLRTVERSGLGDLEETPSNAPAYLDSANTKLQRVKSIVK